MNVSALNNPDVESSKATETKDNWRTWQERKKRYYTDRVRRFRRTYNNPRK